MRIIHRYFGMLLLISCLIGLVVPSVGSGTSLIVIVSLAFIIFCSFFQVNFSSSALATDITLSFKFWLARYVIIPVIAYFSLKWISEFYALVLLLSFILPAAVSSPAFTAIFGGKPELSLKILLYSSFLAVITIPILMRMLGGSAIHVSAGQMLLTLVYTIVVPFVLHLPLRHINAVKEIVGRYNAMFTLLALGTIFIVVTARNKPAILANPQKVGLYALIALVIYAIMYILGYYLFPNLHRDVRRTFSISSGANNIGLGVTITALFFPGDMNIFFIVSQLILVLMLIPLRKAFKH